MAPPARAAPVVVSAARLGEALPSNPPKAPGPHKREKHNPPVLSGQSGQSVPTAVNARSADHAMAAKLRAHLRLLPQEKRPGKASA